MTNMAHHMESVPHAIASLQRTTLKIISESCSHDRVLDHGRAAPGLKPGPLAPEARFIPVDQAAGRRGYGLLKQLGHKVYGIIKVGIKHRAEPKSNACLYKLAIKHVRRYRPRLRPR